MVTTSIGRQSRLSNRNAVEDRRRTAVSAPIDASSGTLSRVNARGDARMEALPEVLFSVR
jgi:hypothetical protein